MCCNHCILVTTSQTHSKRTMNALVPVCGGAGGGGGVSRDSKGGCYRDKQEATDGGNKPPGEGSLCAVITASLKPPVKNTATALTRRPRPSSSARVGPTLPTPLAP